MGKCDAAALYRNVATVRTKWVICQPHTPTDLISWNTSSVPILWRLFLPLKRYGNFVEERNIFALPAIEARFLLSLARHLLTLCI